MIRVQVHGSMKKNNVQIKQGLEISGVPPIVYKTTLVLEGHQKLRDMILVNQFFNDDAETKGFFVYGSSPTNTRKIFYLIAKELFLSGMSVYCISLLNLMEELDSQEITKVTNSVDQSKCIFILDFFEDDAAFPFTPLQAWKLRAWVKDKFNKTGMVCFLSDVRLIKCVDWWPKQFLTYLRENIIEYEVIVKA